MINYSYNQPGPSISRLDELLSRNEMIYQNLKQKLDDINKSSQNIHRNITHIQTIYPQTSTYNPAASILTESSAVLQENHLRSLYSQRQKNLNSIDQSNQITFCEMMPVNQEQIRLINSQERLIEVMREQSRLKEIEFLLKKKRLQEDRQFQLKKLNKFNQIYYQQDPLPWQPQGISRAETSELPELVKQQQQSPLYFPSRFQNEPTKNAKGNSVYLKHTPKITPQSQRSDNDEMPTFRDLQERQRSSSRGDGKSSSSRVEKQGNSSRVEKQKGTPKINQKPVSPRLNIPIIQDQKQSQRQPLFELIKIENKSVQKEKIPTSEINKQTNRSHGTNLSNNFENSSNQISFVAVTPQQSPEYRMLSNTINQGLNYLINSPQCFLFVPFNKVYRSPILQIKPGGHILLQRKSKTASIRKDTNISDPIRYKFKSVITDEQVVIKMLFGGRQSLDLTQRQSKKIAIIGKRDTLKKKLHLGLMAYLLQSVSTLIYKTRNSILVKIEHQEIGREGNEGIVDAEVNVRLGGQRIALLQLQRAGDDICQAIKRGKAQQKVLRVSNVSVRGEQDWSFSIISSNRVDYQFLRCLGVSRICWSVNPLVKNYEDVRQTLESMRQFTNLRPSFE